MNDATLMDKGYNRKKLALAYVLMASGATTGQVQHAFRLLTVSQSRVAAKKLASTCRSRISKSFYDPQMGVHLKTWSYGVMP